MPKKKIKPEDPEQYKRFVKKAKELGCDTQPLDEAFEKVVNPKRKKH
ncbi:MAG: hypothetical protein OXC42_08985 [Gammaproteobacteria bacterium]|nr:hypothetical protein [Gammaproteobacteria bacterium]